MRIFRQLTRCDYDRIAELECVHFVQKNNQNALHPRSIRAPLLGLSWTMRDNETKLQT